MLKSTKLTGTQDNIQANKSLGNTYLILASTDYYAGQTEQAYRYLLEAELLLKEADIEKYQACLRLKGHVLLRMKEYQQALATFEEVYKYWIDKQKENTGIYKSELSISLQDIGETCQGHNDPKIRSRAWNYFKQSYDLTEELYLSDIDNQKYRNAYAIANAWQGEMHFEKNNLDQAFIHFFAHYVIACKLVEQFTDTYSYLDLLGVANSNLGKVYLAMDEPNTSLQLARKQLEFYLKLVEFDPNNAFYKEKLSITYEQLGVLGEMIDGVNARIRAVCIADQLHYYFPKDMHLQEEMAASFRALGNEIAKDGVDEAEHIYKRGQALLRRQLEKLPGDISIQYSMALTHARLGDLYKKQGKQNKEFWHYRKYCTAMEKLHELFKESERYCNELASANTSLGTIYDLKEKRHKAISFFEKALQLRRNLAEVSKKNLRNKYFYGLICGKLAKVYDDCFLAEGNKEYILQLAIARFEEHYDLAFELYESDKENKKYQYSMAIACYGWGYIHINYSEDKQTGCIHLKQCLNMFRQLAKQFFFIPKCYEWIGMICSTLLDVSIAHKEQRKVMVYARLKYAATSKLCFSVKNNDRYQNLLIKSLIQLGTAYLDNEDKENAQKTLETAILLLNGFTKEHMNNTEFVNLQNVIMSIWTSYFSDDSVRSNTLSCT